jgi:hypothetical protein
MAKYKVLLTVKDRYGSLKELDAGHIDIDTKLTDEDLMKIDVPVYVPDVTPDNILKYTLMESATEDVLEFDIDKSNDWNATDSTVGSSYVWEPMQ